MVEDNIFPLDYNKVVAQLPAQYRGENVYHVWNVYVDSMNEIIDVFREMKASHLNPSDLGNTGTLLDQVGNNWGVPRPTGMSDDEYRYIIWSNIMSKMLSGNIQELYEVAKKIIFEDDDSKFFLDEIYDLTLYGQNERCAYLLLGTDNTNVSKTDLFFKFIKETKVAGVGVIQRVTSNPILGDDGRFYDIFRRVDYEIFNTIKNTRDSHILIESNRTDNIRIIIPPKDILTNPNKEIKVSTDKRIYLQTTTDAIQNDEFILTSNTKYKIYSYRENNILWEEG